MINYYNNDIILKNSFVAGDNLGWICKTSGTLGTLVGVTATTTNGSYTITVNSATNLVVGQYISIAGVSGTKRITYISGTTITLATTCNASVVGAAVSYIAPSIEVLTVQIGNSTGIVTPILSLAPIFIGQEYLDTATSIWYKSTGLTNNDWVNITNLLNVTSISSSSYNATKANDIISCNAVSNTVTVNLPSAVGIIGKSITVRKSDSSTNSVFIIPSDTQNINGNTSVEIQIQYASLTFVSDGTNWMIV
jgi:hypothetical protein